MDLFTTIGVKPEVALLVAGVGLAAALLMAAWIGYRRRGQAREGLSGLSDR